MRKIFILLFVLSFSGMHLYAQELNCTVQVVSPKIQGTNDKQVFQTLQTAIYNFMNTTKWTNDVFKNYERIECSMLINITDKVSAGEYDATIQVQSRRPVYKTSYNTVLLNFNDNDFHFNYTQFQPMQFNINTYTSNLTSVLAYYAYMIIGLDYDSFSPHGGTPYYEKAMTIVNNAQNSNEKGWKAFDSDKNRYWLVQNMLDPTYAPLRTCIYDYHRLGLDIMQSKLDDGRQEILKSLQLLQDVYNQKPGSFSLQVFFNAKADELVNIFKKAYPDEKSKAVNILSQIDPANSNKYDNITSGGSNN